MYCLASFVAQAAIRKSLIQIYVEVKIRSDFKFFGKKF